jgi:CelD/BcsL family acetyltransferase involved in cellulose biosynthesis
MYSINTYRTLDDQKLKKYWEKLYSESHLCLQNSYEWISLWWQFFGGKKRALYIVSVEENEKILGIGPFMIEKNKSLKQLKFIGSGLTDYHSVITASQNSKAVISRLLDFITAQKDYHLINLEQIPDNSELYLSLKQDERFTSREMVICPIVNFNAASWEEYFKKFSRNFRRDWTKKYNRLSRIGEIALKKVVTVEDKQEYLEKIFAIHTKRWKQEKHASKLEQDNIRQFISTVALEIPQITIYLLLLDKNIISYRLGFSQGDVYYAWNTSFDPNYYAYSIGRILLGLVIKDLLKSDFTKINFMRGDYDFKRRWMTDETTLSNFQFLSGLNTWRGNIGLKYYMRWKWWAKEKFKKILNKSFVEKILFRRKN